jgi:PadR family transcriptional regulator, regulatory protein PadR
MHGEWLKGHLDLLLLAVLREQPLHGYAVVEALAQRSDGAFVLPEGTIYPALHRLERAGLLSSHPTEVSGRRRRVYQVTAEGSAAMAEFERNWERFAHGVEAVLRRAGGE